MTNSGHNSIGTRRPARGEWRTLPGRTTALLATVCLLIGLSFLLPEKTVERGPKPIELTGGGYPVPPLDLRVPDKNSPKAVRARKRRQAVPVGAGSDEAQKETES